MVITIAVEDYAIVECDEMEEGDVAGYKFTYDQLVEFAKWLSENSWSSNHIVFGEDRIAGVYYDDEQSYIEDWSIRLNEERNLFEFYDCWATNPYGDRSDSWYNEDNLICDIIRCFKNTDNIVFNKTPKINYYEYDADEDE